jgi:hypothetical protein
MYGDGAILLFFADETANKAFDVAIENQTHQLAGAPPLWSDVLHERGLEENRNRSVLRQTIRASSADTPRPKFNSRVGSPVSGLSGSVTSRRARVH